MTDLCSNEAQPPSHGDNSYFLHNSCSKFLYEFLFVVS